MTYKSNRALAALFSVPNKPPLITSLFILVLISFWWRDLLSTINKAAELSKMYCKPLFGSEGISMIYKKLDISLANSSSWHLPKNLNITDNSAYQCWYVLRAYDSFISMFLLISLLNSVYWVETFLENRYTVVNFWVHFLLIYEPIDVVSLYRVFVDVSHIQSWPHGLCNFTRLHTTVE